MLKIIEIKNQAEWDGFVDKAKGHPLQAWGWGELKKSSTWKVKRIFILNTSNKPQKKEKYSDVVAGAQILIRKLPFPLKNFAYIPRGPIILSSKNEERLKLIDEIARYCNQNIKPRPVCLSIEPDWEDFSPPNLKGKGAKKWRKARNTILIPRTLVLDLSKTDEELLSVMSKKTRQYIRKSSSEVSVRKIEKKYEIEKALDIYEETAKRANFRIHSRKYYLELHEKMADRSVIYGAFVKNTDKKPSMEDVKSGLAHNSEEMVAFLWNVTGKNTSFELYGGVDDKGQAARANYILKWLTIKQMQSQGIVRYDMNGLLNDGISRFKQGFAKHENMLCGTWDYPFKSSYLVWNNFLPLAKKIIRIFKK